MLKRLLVVMALGASPLVAHAQASATVELRLGLPVVLPQLVVVSPGVQVVPEVEEEVFFTDGYYWCRHDGGWYRSRDHRGGWVFVPGRTVPARLVQLPPGRYKHYRPAGRPAPAPAPGRWERVDDRDDDRGHHDNGKHKGHEKHEKHDKHDRD